MASAWYSPSSRTRYGARSNARALAATLPHDPAGGARGNGYDRVRMTRKGGHDPSIIMAISSAAVANKAGVKSF